MKGIVFVWNVIMLLILREPQDGEVGPQDGEVEPQDGEVVDALYPN
ncbi:MAG: hypothetical protein NT018_09695 [Armatimonadetes bacterium]|nr:hypothetical protein [Armatimonadota bacterium]